MLLRDRGVFADIYQKVQNLTRSCSKLGQERMSQNQSDGQEELRVFVSRSKTKAYAVGVMLAAIYGVLILIPMSAFVGALGIATGGIPVAICVVPLFGIMLGPTKGLTFGLVAGIVAAFLALVVAPISLAVPTMLLGPAVSGSFTGLCLRRTTRFGSMRVPGPIITALYLLTVILLYEVPNSAAWWFMTPYVLALVIALVLQVKSIDYSQGLAGARKYLQLVPLVLIGTMTDFSMMTMGAVYILGIPADVFGFVVFPLMLAERTVAVIVGSFLAALMLATFRDLWSWTDLRTSVVIRETA